MIDVVDIVVAIAYYIVPVELLAMLMFYPHLARMPRLIFGMVILFAVFTFSCGTMHLLRGIGKMDTVQFRVVNICTAVGSVLSALYLIPLFPRILSVIDRFLRETREFNSTLIENSRKNDAFASFLYHELQGPLHRLAGGEDTHAQEQICNLTELLIDPDIMYCEIRRQIRVVCSAVKYQVSLRGTNNASYCNEVDFQYDVANDIPQRLLGSRQKLLGQILYNLLSIGVTSSSLRSTNEGQRSVLVNLNVRLIEWKAASRMGFVQDTKCDQVMVLSMPGLRDFRVISSEATTMLNAWLTKLASMLKGSVTLESASSSKTLYVYLPVSVDTDNSSLSLGVAA